MATAPDRLVTYQLHRREVIPATLDQVFTFFKDPRNLEALTPPWLAFRILRSTDAEVKVGMRIRYRLRLHGIPVQWESRITEYVEGSHFADEQVSGPYRSWYHRHEFRTIAGGVEMTDRVDYTMPFGPIGRLAHAVAVRRQLRLIFDFRTRMIMQRFPGPATTNPAPPAVMP